MLPRHHHHNGTPYVPRLGESRRLSQRGLVVGHHRPGDAHTHRHREHSQPVQHTHQRGRAQRQPNLGAPADEQRLLHADEYVQLRRHLYRASAHVVSGLGRRNGTPTPVHVRLHAGRRTVLLRHTGGHPQRSRLRGRDVGGSAGGHAVRRALSQDRRGSEIHLARFARFQFGVRPARSTTAAAAATAACCGDAARPVTPGTPTHEDVPLIVAISNLTPVGPLPDSLSPATR